MLRIIGEEAAAYYSGQKRAEAVMDLIRSQNDLALGASVSQLQGALWKKIERIRGEILHETLLGPRIATAITSSMVKSFRGS